MNYSCQDRNTVLWQALLPTPMTRKVLLLQTTINFYMDISRNSFENSGMSYDQLVEKTYYLMQTKQTLFITARKEIVEKCTLSAEKS